MPDTGIIIDGRFVLSNTFIGFSLVNIHTRPENFHLPSEYHPEILATCLNQKARLVNEPKPLQVKLTQRNV